MTHPSKWLILSYDSELASAGYFSFEVSRAGTVRCQQGLQSLNISAELDVQDASFTRLEVGAGFLGAHLGLPIRQPTPAGS